MNLHNQADQSIVFAPHVDVSTNDVSVLKKSLMHMEAQISHMRRRLLDAQKVAAGRDCLDPVAGVLNRDGIINKIDIQGARIQKGISHGGSFILADIDNYEDINGKHGSYVLSLCVRQSADVIINDLCHSGDIAYIGGGEFIILLPDIQKKKVIQDVQFLRSRLDKIAFDWNGSAIKVKSSVAVHGYASSNYIKSVL